MTPSEAAASFRAATSAGVPSIVSKPGTSLLDSFWMHVYQIPGANAAADAVIHAGNAIDNTKKGAVTAVQNAGAAVASTAKAASTGIKLGLEFGPLLIILFVALYFLAPTLGLFRRG